jgi:hypothetical protein
MILTPTASAPKPPSWSCLVQAWAKVVRWPYWAVVRAIGHDGSEIVWPDQPEPFNRRAFHPQELIYLGDRLGFVCTTFEPQPLLESGQPPVVITSLHGAFKEIVDNSEGVFTGTRQDGLRHAIAWINGEVQDCNESWTRVENLDDFNIQTYYRIKSKWWHDSIQVSAD